MMLLLLGSGREYRMEVQDHNRKVQGLKSDKIKLFLVHNFDVVNQVGGVNTALPQGY